MKIMKIALSIVLVATFAVATLAQDPLIVAPHAYKLRFENDWVRVIEVNYGPKEKVVAHDHTATNTAYVYLNDSGPVVFNHLDTEYSAVTRPATKAGSFRVYYGLPETHEVINTTDIPSRFLRVELKTEAKNSLAFKGKFFREAYPAGENFAKVEMDHEQIRITRLVVATGKSIDVSTSALEPTLLVALSDGDLRANRGVKKEEAVPLKTGQTEWIDRGVVEHLRNSGSAPVEFLRFEFKTPPMSEEALRAIRALHAHPKT